MTHYKTIYGEDVEGEIVTEYKHVVIVQKKNGGQVMVHRRSFDPEYQDTKTALANKTTKQHFDLEKTQQRGE